MIFFSRGGSISRFVNRLVLFLLLALRTKGRERCEGESGMHAAADHTRPDNGRVEGEGGGRREIYMVASSGAWGGTIDPEAAIGSGPTASWLPPFIPE